MNEEKKKAGYWFLVQKTYRFWADVRIDADTPEEGRRRAGEEFQTDWTRSELLEEAVTLTAEEGTENEQ